MTIDIPQFLQLMILGLWVLFPNGVMLIATWLSFHWFEGVPPVLNEDDSFWIPGPVR